MPYGIWRAPSLSELTLMILNMWLTHLGLETSIYKAKNISLLENRKTTIKSPVCFDCYHLSFILLYLFIYVLKKNFTKDLNPANV